METKIEIKMREDCGHCDGRGVHVPIFEKRKEICCECEGRGWRFTELGMDMINTLGAVYDLHPLLLKDQMTDEAKRFAKRKAKKAEGDTQDNS